MYKRQGPYRTRDGFLIRSKDMGQRLSLQKQRGNQTVQLFQGLDVYKRQVLTSMGGPALFRWMEKNHFAKMGARFLREAAKNNAGLVLPGCQPVYNPMFGQWLYKNKKMYEELSLIHICPIKEEPCFRQDA